MKLSPDSKEAFSDQMAAKFIATRDENGTPNIAMISSTMPWDDEHLIFGNFLMWQTQKNLEIGSPVSVSVMTLDFKCFEVRGSFLGFETSGEKFDEMSKQDIFRYSAIGLLRSVGTITVDEIFPIKLSNMSVAKEWFLSRIASTRLKNLPNGKKINPVAKRNASVLRGAKFLTVLRNDHLEQFPVLGMRPVYDYLVIKPDLPLKEGDLVAVSILTMDLVAFQFKGEYIGVKRSRGAKFGYIKVGSVKTQNLPLVSREVPSDNFNG